MAFGLIFRSFLLAIGQLSDPRFRRVFFMGIALALALLIGFTTAFTWFTDWITPEELWVPILGEVRWLSLQVASNAHFDPSAVCVTWLGVCCSTLGSGAF